MGRLAAMPPAAPFCPGSNRRRRASGRKFLRQLNLCQDECHLLHWKRDHMVDNETRAFIRKGMKQDSFCSRLEEQELEAILEAMQYFAFEGGQTVLRQGDAGRFFWVVQEGCLEATEGEMTKALGRGDTFGGDALLYNCPRSSTVVTRGPCGLWGADGETFQRVLREHALRRHAEHSRFLSSIGLFMACSGLEPRLEALTPYSRVVEVGERVTTAGEYGRAVYVIKSGEVSVVRGGHVNEAGELIGASTFATLTAGDSFGMGGLLRLKCNQPFHGSTVVKKRCELLCLSYEDLKAVWGDKLDARMELGVKVFGLTQSPVLAGLSASQRVRLAEAMETRRYGPLQPLEEELQLLVVTRGAVLKHGAACCTTSQLEQGQAFQAPGLFTQFPAAPSTDGARGLAAGPEGAEVAAFTREGLQEAFVRLGLLCVAGPDGSWAHVQSMQVALKASLLSCLPQEQANRVVRLLAPQHYTWGARIVQQGEVARGIFFVCSGQLEVLVDGRVVRTLGRLAHFGERALLHDGPRTASVRVSSACAEVLRLEKAAFLEMLTPNLKEHLLHRIQLQDSDARLKDLVHVKLVGAGSFGAVRLVEHQETGVRYALKRVRKVHGKVPQDTARECEVLAEMDHPLVMQMVKTMETVKSVYILSELITGGDLWIALSVMARSLSRREAQFYTASLLLVLEVLHERNIVFRDLKPENVMLDSQGYIKLIDFGLAKKLDGTRRTFTTTGTPSYMAPEVLYRGRGYGLEVDVWSLGVMLYEMVCACLPFASNNDSPAFIFQQVLSAPLTFPNWYRDAAGRALLQGLLERQPECRLGGGVEGCAALKEHAFFTEFKGGDLFSKVMGRELAAPYVAAGQQYMDPGEMEDVTLSDSEDLGSSSSGEEVVVHAVPSC